MIKAEYEKRIQDAKGILTRVECERRELHLANGDVITWDGCKHRFLIQVPRFGVNWIDRETAIEAVMDGGEWRLW